jgi:hypothetical protein
MQNEIVNDELLADEIGKFYNDPLGFVMFAYDWGVGDLKGFNGPDEWQREALNDWGNAIKERNFDGVNPVAPYQSSISSGHGIGKSAFTAWVTNFIMSTRPYCKGVITANTSPQLQTKTWAEVAKWTKRSINGHWFDVTTGMGSMKMVHKDHPESWRVDALTSTKENAESFAGLHAANSTPFYIFDEASAVPDIIWDVAEGGLTDGEPMWFVFGNPTRASGRFHQCFNRQKHRWNTKQIDSRTAKMTNKKKIQEWVDDYGEDSDFVRVRVRGQFPKQGSLQFIPSDYVERCNEYDVEVFKGSIRTIAVDVARFGDDQTVISYKAGRKLYPLYKYRELDTMATASLVAEGIESFKPHAVFIDGGGVGGGVVDRLTLLGYNVFDVNFGSGANDSKKYMNKRVEMYGLLKEAMKAGLDFPDDIELGYELQAIEYDYNDKQQIRLESKKAMKKRGLSSPDCADAVALHFAEPVNMTEVDEDEGMNYNHRNDGRNQTTGY